MWGEEIEKVLQNCAADDAHVVRIVDKWIRTETFRPSPAEMYETAEGIPRSTFIAHRNPKCPACQGTGWSPGWVLITIEANENYSHRTAQRIGDESAARELAAKVDGISQGVYSGVERCRECDYGRALVVAEIAEKRQQDVETKPPRNLVIAGQIWSERDDE